MKGRFYVEGPGWRRRAIFYDDGTHRGIWREDLHAALIFERGELTGCFDQAETLAATKDGGLRLQGAQVPLYRRRAVTHFDDRAKPLLDHMPDPTPFLIALDYFVENRAAKPEFVTGKPLVGSLR